MVFHDDQHLHDQVFLDADDTPDESDADTKGSGLGPKEHFWSSQKISLFGH